MDKRVHKAITDEVLCAEGLGQASRLVIEVGNLSQDLDRQTRGDPTHHFDDNSLAGSLDEIEQHQQSIAQRLAKPKITRQDDVEALHEFGQELHTIQDFYAHSNYIEIKLKENPQLRPQDIPLMDFSKIRNHSEPELSTGFYYYKNMLRNEQEEFYLSRTGVIKVLEDQGEKIPNTQFMPSDRYERLKSFQDRINYFTNRQYSFLHRDLNKDNRGSDEGRVVNPETGISLHDYARNLALRETKRQWTLLESVLQSSHGQVEIDALKRLPYGDQVKQKLFTIDGFITSLL